MSKDLDDVVHAHMLALLEAVDNDHVTASQLTDLISQQSVIPLKPESKVEVAPLKTLREKAAADGLHVANELESGRLAGMSLTTYAPLHRLLQLKIRIKEAAEMRQQILAMNSEQCKVAEELIQLAKRTAFNILTSSMTPVKTPSRSDTLTTFRRVRESVERSLLAEMELLVPVAQQCTLYCGVSLHVLEISAEYLSATSAAVDDPAFQYNPAVHELRKRTINFAAGHLTPTTVDVAALRTNMALLIKQHNATNAEMAILRQIVNDVEGVQQQITQPSVAQLAPAPPSPAVPSYSPSPRAESSRLGGVIRHTPKDPILSPIAEEGLPTQTPSAVAKQIFRIPRSADSGSITGSQRRGRAPPTPPVSSIAKINGALVEFYEPDVKLPLRLVDPTVLRRHPPPSPSIAGSAGLKPATMRVDTAGRPRSRSPRSVLGARAKEHSQLRDRVQQSFYIYNREGLGEAWRAARRTAHSVQQGFTDVVPGRGEMLMASIMQQDDGASMDGSTVVLGSPAPSLVPPPPAAYTTRTPSHRSISPRQRQGVPTTSAQVWDEVFRDSGRSSSVPAGSRRSPRPDLPTNAKLGSPRSGSVEPLRRSPRPTEPSDVPKKSHVDVNLVQRGRFNNGTPASKADKSIELLRDIVRSATRAKMGDDLNEELAHAIQSAALHLGEHVAQE